MKFIVLLLILLVASSALALRKKKRTPYVCSQGSMLVCYNDPEFGSGCSCMTYEYARIFQEEQARRWEEMGPYLLPRMSGPPEFFDPNY